MLFFTRRQLVWMARYFVTVPVATIVLVVLRWSDAAGTAGWLALVADSVWQASVWPLYLLMLVFGAA